MCISKILWLHIYSFISVVIQVSYVKMHILLLPRRNTNEHCKGPFINYFLGFAIPSIKHFICKKYSSTFYLVPQGHK